MGLGFGVFSTLVEQLAQQDGHGGLVLAIQGSARETLSQVEVSGVIGLLGSSGQQGRFGLPSGNQPPRGHTKGILTAASAQTLNCLGQPTRHFYSRRTRSLSTQDLAVHGMSERYRPASSIVFHADEPCSFHLLQVRMRM
jgi:hypothetical protein